MTIIKPAVFHLHSTINSHGWCDLPPFRTNETKTELYTVLSLTKMKHPAIRIREQQNVLIITTENSPLLSITEKEKIKNVVRSILRIDEPLTEFYSMCRKEAHLQWIPKRRAGRILRSPTMFEDVVKMMFTTNCSWALTKIQTIHLTTKLGNRVNGQEYSFPTPESIAKRSELWLRKEISCGYRAPYLLELCRNLVDKKIDVESMRSSSLPSEELYWQLRSIKGIGHYAAGNLMKLLGRYDYLGIDSWVRKRFSQIHANGRKIADKTIEKYYHRYGKWRGLICLMEITSNWYE